MCHLTLAPHYIAIHELTLYNSMPDWPSALPTPRINYLQYTQHSDLRQVPTEVPSYLGCLKHASRIRTVLALEKNTPGTQHDCTNPKSTLDLHTSIA